MIIDTEEEFTRDWDWYAVDQNGCIGHFTSAGFRALPKSVKQDRERTKKIGYYFFEEAPVISEWSVRAHAEVDCGGWAKPGKDRYVRDFVQMASKGLFSFDTELTRSANGRYFLVAIPEQPLRVDDLPAEIKVAVMEVRAPLRFIDTPYIGGSETTAW
jgi:hypothetical protein